MTQSDNAGRTSLHYRAYLPMGISLVVAVVVASVLLALYWLAMRVGAPSYLASSTVVVVTVLVTNVFFKRDVVLSSDGRLTVTGLGQHIDVDVRCLTEISVSAVARGGFGLARVRWNGKRFWMWQAMIYPRPGHRFSKGRTSGSVSEDFRDLVYRLYLINPAVRIRGVGPPAWARPDAMPRPPAIY